MQRRGKGADRCGCSEKEQTQVYFEGKASRTHRQRKRMVVREREHQNDT